MPRRLRGRRHLLNRLDQPDPYCPVVRGDMRRLSHPHGGRPRFAEAGERLHNDRHRP